jgi:hypothetical protein
MGRVTDRDLGLNEIRKELEKLGTLSVKAGIPENAGENNGTSIAQYGYYNEYGAESKKNNWKIPARPFVRGWTDNERTKIKTTLEKLYGSVANGKLNADDAIERLGLFAQSGIRRYIANGDFAPNAESTIKRKKSSRPLIDDGTMRSSIGFEVISKGPGGSGEVSG